jgi:hypothetical protein
VTECDRQEIPFFHPDRAFRFHDPPQAPTTSVDQGLVPRFANEVSQDRGLSVRDLWWEGLAGPVDDDGRAAQRGPAAWGHGVDDLPVIE